MIKLSRKDIKLIENYNQNEFARWLRVGLEEYLLTGQRGRAFAPVELCIGRRLELVEYLQNIFYTLPPVAQDNFRQGIAGVLSDIESVAENILIVEELLMLAGMIRAREIIPAIIDRIGNGFFGFPDIEGTKHIYRVALETVAGMVAQEKKDLECLYTLRRSTNYYQELYCDIVFIALCRAAPEEYPAHLKDLRTNFNALIMQRKVREDQLQDLAWQFVDTVPLNVIVKYIEELDLSLTTIGYNDLWFTDALFRGDNSPLKIPFFTESSATYPCIYRADRLNDPLEILHSSEPTYKIIMDRYCRAQMDWAEVVDANPKTKKTNNTINKYINCLSQEYEPSAYDLSAAV